MPSRLSVTVPDTMSRGSVMCLFSCRPSLARPPHVRYEPTRPCQLAGPTDASQEAVASCGWQHAVPGAARGNTRAPDAGIPREIGGLNDSGRGDRSS